MHMDNREFEQIDPDNVDEFLRKKMMEAADRYEEELNSDPSLAGLEPSPRVFENIMEMIGKEESVGAGEPEAGSAETLETKAVEAKAENNVEPESEPVPGFDSSSPEAFLSEEDRRALQLGRKQLAHPVRRRVLRVLGVAAAVLVGIFGASMTSEANRVKLINTLNVLIGREGVMRLSNEERRETMTVKEQEAWAEIQEKLGVSPIAFRYRPDKMEYDGFEVNEIVGRANVFYKYEDTILYIRVENKYNDMSQGRVMDGDVIKTMDIENEIGSIKITQIQSGQETDYLAEFQYNNSYYAVYGVFPEQEFLQMIKNIWIY